MGKKITNEEVKMKLNSYGVELLSEYTGSNELMTMKCSCGEIFKKSWKTMNRHKFFKCNECVKKEQSIRNSIPYEIAVKRVEEKGYKLLTPKEKYKKFNSKYEIECPNGHIYKQNLNDLYMGHGCKKCASKRNSEKQRLNYEYVKDKINEFGFKLLSNDYKNTDEKLKVKCNKCGEIFYPTFHNLQKGSGCPKCYDKLRSTSCIIPYEERLEYVKAFGYDIITPKERYVNGAQKILLKCNHGHIYETTLNDFNDGRRCSKCNQSKGEIRIKEYLKNNNINFIEQYKFDNCRAKRKLPFDFYLPLFNILIEYDGRQHYEISKHFGGIDAFIGTKVRDTIKNIYCNENNIKLIRIPYWNFNNIEIILNEKIINKLD